MTLIAAAGIDTFPAIFGDLLVSGPEARGPAPTIPPPGQIENVSPVGPASSISDLNQKVVLLGDNCVVAWAGTVAFARVVIRALRAMASKEPLSIAIIEAYLPGIDSAAKDEGSLVGWVRENGDFRQFWYRTDIAHSAMFGRISALKQDYAGEALLLQVLSIHRDGTTDPPIVEEARQVILPFASDIDAAEPAGISWPGIAAMFRCHVVLVRSPKGTSVFNRIDYSESRAPTSIQFFSLDEGHTSFQVSQQFCEELAQSLRTGFAAQ
jgi:hypothetical protein